MLLSLYAARTPHGVRVFFVEVGDNQIRHRWLQPRVMHPSLQLKSGWGYEGQRENICFKDFCPLWPGLQKGLKGCSRVGVIFCLVLGQVGDCNAKRRALLPRFIRVRWVVDNKADLFTSKPVKSYCFCLAGHAENHPIGAHTWVCTHGPGTTHWSSQANGF